MAVTVKVVKLSRLEADTVMAPVLVLKDAWALLEKRLLTLLLNAKLRGVPPVLPVGVQVMLVFLIVLNVPLFG